MRKINGIKKFLRIAVLALPISALAVGTAAPAMAAVNNPAPAAKVSFTFDDALTSAVTQAAPTLAAHGLTGTDYVITDCVGMTTAPNTCPADGNVSYMTWAQVKQLRDTYGWEIGGHSISHPQLATDNLTDAQLANEVAGSKAALAAQGIDATAFASPYGDYDNRTLAEIAKSYSSHRGFHDLDNNVWSYNDYLLNNMQVQAGVTVAQVQARIDDAIANNLWLVLTFHEISTNPSSNAEDYQYSTAMLDEIAAYVKSKQDAGLIKSTNISDGLVTSDSNLLTNGGFDAGLSGGWTTSQPTTVKADAANHGSTPGSTNSISFTSGTANAHLFSPKVSVDSTQTYMYKSYLAMTARTSGELGYYVDEYDAAGNWISGQWVQAIVAPITREVNFSYKPTSANVKQASLQIYTTANSGIQAYVDNVQMFSLNGTSTPPPQATTNVLANSNFNNGIADGWTTNNATAFTADNSGNGSSTTTEEAQSAIKLLAGTANASLFAPQVTVTSLNSYTVNAYLNVLTRGSEEVAFYIDEYNSAGSWISGQYVFAKRTTGVENVSFNYTPTSVNVSKAGLQVILVGNSGITGYLDNVQFLAPGGATPTPSPTPTPTPAPTGTNLVANGDFANGLSDGWTTNDPTNITADTANHGSSASPTDAIKLISTDANKHLFSPLVTVDPTKTYNLASWLNIEQLTSGEVGFYIDEYDVNGNWISGQYKTGVRVISTGDVTFDYTPTSTNVSKASLQIIVVGGSGLQGYIDNVRWLQY